MTWQSRVPDVLDALVTKWRALPELSGLVQDGPVPLDDPSPELLSVGHDGDTGDGTSTDGVVSPEGYGTEPNREQFTVNCLIAVLNGANDMPAARGRAFELLSVASDALAEDHTLGGVVMYAHVQEVSLRQVQDDYGALAQVMFTVACDAFTAR